MPGRVEDFALHSNVVDIVFLCRTVWNFKASLVAFSASHEALNPYS